MGDGLLDLGARVVFCHPLLRSAIYGSAPAEDRRAVHRALAAATDAALDPDRRAWHRAQAAVGPDEDVAEELERSAGRAQARGGLAAAAAFLERSAALTLEPGARARRALEAAGAKQLAGAPEEALSLLSAAADGPLEELDDVMLQRLHGQIALDLRRAGDAVPLLLDAARRLEALDPGSARDTYAEALRAASVAGRLGGGMLAAATAVRNAPPRPGPPRALDLMLDGMAIRFTEGYAASADALRQALAAVREQGDGRDRTCGGRGSPAAWRPTSSRTTRGTRSLCATSRSPATPARSRCFRSPSTSSRSCGASRASSRPRRRSSTSPTRSRMRPAPHRSGSAGSCSPGVAGTEAQAMQVFEAGEAAAIERSEGVVLTFGEHARALLHNGLGEYAGGARARPERK